MGTQIETVTKLDAAKRQLFTAIGLFFQRGDSVSVHTLAAAVHDVLLPIVKKKSPEAALMSSLNPENPVIAPDRRKEWADWTREAQNFFKHGSRDGANIFHFKPEVTAFHLLDCVMLYEVLAGGADPEISVFKTWIFLKYPRLLKDGPLKEALAKAAEVGCPPNPNDLETFFRAIASQRGASPT
jgi:hypothetical protein